MLCEHILLSIILAYLSCVEGARKLNDYIRNYEPLNYNHREVHHKHQRARRSTTNPHVNIHFTAHGRDFDLLLVKDSSIFAPDFILNTPDGDNKNYDTSHIVEGRLQGDRNSLVHGAILDGVFEGTIHTSDNNYYVERAHHYFKNATNFHSVIYKDKDIRDAHRHKRDVHSSGCGGTGKIAEWMKKIQTSAVVSSKENKKKRSPNSVNWNPTLHQELYHNDHHRDGSHNVYRREAQKIYAPRNTTIENLVCTLYIQTDTFLWDYFHKTDESKTREEITALISSHVKAVRIIYEDEDFLGIRGIKFTVQRVTINDTRSCFGNNRTTNPYCNKNIDVSNLLNLNSQTNHSAFCLAYVFTYRDFVGGTLGLAWVASPSGALGGICEEYKDYTEHINGYRIKTSRSLNTGIITFVNYNTRVPPKVSQLTLAHEIGHNFGSPHDWPTQCVPGGSTGNFIMFASATSGDKPNNNKFSECSIKNMSEVLKAVLHESNNKHNCFQADNGSFCGNKLTEIDEECDCGYNHLECMESCCYPREILPFHKQKDPNAQGCKLQLNALCSPSQGPCCNSDCTFESSKVICKPETECSELSNCTGKSPFCPPQPHKENKTACYNNTQVCWSGECTGSICQKYDLEECFLTQEAGANPEEMCHVACQKLGLPQTCLSSFKSDHFNKTGIFLRAGSPCNNYKGYCDVFLKCRDVDAEGPLARLKNLLFNKETLLTIAQWITQYWWAVMLMGIGLIILMALFIKCCAVHTPSSNPKKPPARRFSETISSTLRRRPRGHRPVQQQAPSRPGTAQAMYPAQSAVPIISSSQPPPPYSETDYSRPGRGGPSHGYGEGRGHYQRHAQAGRPKGGRHSGIEMRTQKV